MRQMNSLMPSLNATWQQGRMTWTERDTSRELETLICDLREWEPAALGATAVEPQYR